MQTVVQESEDASGQDGDGEQDEKENSPDKHSVYNLLRFGGDNR